MGAPDRAVVPGAAAMVAADGSPSVAGRAGVPLSAPLGAAPVAVKGARKEASSAASAVGGSNVQQSLLSRSFSASKLNAKAPEFVPKGLSTSLPGFPQGLGLSPPETLQAPASVIPVIVAPPSPVQKIESPPTTVVATSPPPTEVLVSTVEAGDVILGQEQVQSQGQATSPGPLPKPVVSEELKAKIVKQVEFYFSEANLPTDNYLMKFVKKDPEGFVPIPVVASFRKIKHLVKNHGIVTAALRSSTQLVGRQRRWKKVRRAQPLPDIDPEEVQARTVVAENLPEDHSIERMEQLFGKVGGKGLRNELNIKEVKLCWKSPSYHRMLNGYPVRLYSVKMVRICHPEAANGANQTAAKYQKPDMVITNKLHALVEYETLEMAEKAVAELNDERNWRSGLRVRLLLRRTFQNKHVYQQAPPQKGRRSNGEGAEWASAGDDEEGAFDKSGEELTGQHADQTEDCRGK